MPIPIKNHLYEIEKLVLFELCWQSNSYLMRKQSNNSKEVLDNNS